MRFIQALLLASCAFVLDGCETCSDPNGCGGLNQTCADWPANDCASGLRCVNDTCLACGGLGDVCCWTAVGPDKCTAPGTVCDETQDATPTCTDQCGLIGKACCGGTSCPDPAGATCNQGVCEANSSTGTPAACGSGPAHFVEILDSSGCVKTDFEFNSSAPDDCIAAMLAELGPGFTAGALDTPPVCGERCQYWSAMPDASTGADEVYACAMDQAALDSCYTSLCTNCLYTNEPSNTCGDAY
jgi:hypothetical protein